MTTGPIPALLPGVQFVIFGTSNVVETVEMPFSWET